MPETELHFDTVGAWRPQAGFHAPHAPCRLGRTDAFHAFVVENISHERDERVLARIHPQRSQAGLIVGRGEMVLAREDLVVGLVAVDPRSGQRQRAGRHVPGVIRAERDLVLWGTRQPVAIYALAPLR